LNYDTLFNNLSILRVFTEAPCCLWRFSAEPASIQQVWSFRQSCRIFYFNNQAAESHTERLCFFSRACNYSMVFQA
jgi:hypothetical protein